MGLLQGREEEVRQEERVDGRAALRDWWMGLLEMQGIGRWAGTRERGHE